VNVALRERNRDVFFVEANFDAFLKLEEEIPVVFDIDPRAEGKVDTAIAHFP
jgi:hypothetical protein